MQKIVFRSGDLVIARDRVIGKAKPKSLFTAEARRRGEVNRVIW
jgi:hypothetical protein